MENIVVVTVTSGNAGELERMGRVLLEERLIACMQIAGPIRSLYRWKGSVEDAKEWLAVIKTRESLVTRLEERIKGMHSYEVPEIVAMPVCDALPAYRRWVIDETGD